MIIIKNAFLPKLIKVQAIVVYPFVLFKSKNPAEEIIGHELIHIAQIKRLGVFKFYFLYLVEYYSNRRKGLSHYDSYRQISFEKEAYGDKI